MKANSSKAAAPTHSLVSLVQGTVIEGTVEAESDIRIDGTINGHLKCKAKVIVGPSGHIKGEIHCQNAVVEGTIDGKLEVVDLLNIRESAKIYGKVLTDKLIVQSGALFNVQCQMGQDGPVTLNTTNPEKVEKVVVDNHSNNDSNKFGKEKHASNR